MKKMIVLIVFSVVLSLAAACVTIPEFTPLPTDIRVVPPSPELPKEIADFSGVWYGIWDNGNPVTLIVEKIKPPTAIVVYSWGKCKFYEGGWRRYEWNEWKIEPRRLEFTSEEITITFLLRENGKILDATYRREEAQIRINYAVMQRQIPVFPLPSAAAPTPLPPTFKIIPPSPELPKEIADFSGIWHGVWSNGRKTTLVVEKIESSTAIVVYSWGKYKRHEGGWIRWEWKIEPGKLDLKSADDLKITYFLLPSGELKGLWEKGQIKLQTIMRKE